MSVDWPAHQRRIFEVMGEAGASYLYTPAAGGSAVAVAGRFSDASALGLSVIEGSAPSFACMRADLADGGAHGAMLTRTFAATPSLSATYKVVGTEPESVSGKVVLKLEKQ